jgi:hypothetical protein
MVKIGSSISMQNGKLTQRRILTDICKSFYIKKTVQKIEKLHAVVCMHATG